MTFTHSQAVQPGEITGETVEPGAPQKHGWPNKRTAWALSEKTREIHALLESGATIEVKHYCMGVFVQWCEDFAGRLGEALPPPQSDDYQS